LEIEQNRGEREGFDFTGASEFSSAYF